MCHKVYAKETHWGTLHFCKPTTRILRQKTHQPFLFSCGPNADQGSFLLCHELRTNKFWLHLNQSSNSSEQCCAERFAAQSKRSLVIALTTKCMQQTLRFEEKERPLSNRYFPKQLARARERLLVPRKIVSGQSRLHDKSAWYNPQTAYLPVDSKNARRAK